MITTFDRKIWLLAALFFFVIGTFWLLGSLQEPIFYHLVGREFHPRANVLSFFCIIPLLIGYLTGLDRWRPQTMFAIATVFYGIFFGVAAFLLTVPGVGLPSAAPTPYNFLGWAFFAVTKTYGSLMVTLFWTYATAMVSVDEAKRSFPFITTCAQVGSLSGATLVRACSDYGIPLLIVGALGGMVAMIFILHFLQRYEALRPVARGEKSAGVFEGLWLLLSNAYLRGFLVLSTAYLVVTAFLDYQLHFLAHQSYPTIEEFAWFKGVYGQWVNGVTLALSLVGTGWFLRHFDVAVSLLVYPLLTALCVVAAWLYPTLGVVAAVMVLIRAFSFGFNNPTKEIIYIPEGEEVRFKAKGWIDIVGYRAAFTAGAQVVSWIAEPYSFFVNASAGISFIIIFIWTYYARIVGRHFKQLRASVAPTR